MRYKVIWTETFEKQLKKILLYLIDNFSYQAAEEYRRFLEEQLLSLAAFPYLGKQIDLLGLMQCLYLVSKKNIIIYRVDEAERSASIILNICK